MFRLLWRPEGPVDPGLVAHLHMEEDSRKMPAGEWDPDTCWLVQFGQDASHDLSGDARGISVFLWQYLDGEKICLGSWMDIDIPEAWAAASKSSLPDEVIERVDFLAVELAKINSTLGAWDPHEDVAISLHFVHVSALERLSEVEP